MVTDPSAPKSRSMIRKPLTRAADLHAETGCTPSGSEIPASFEFEISSNAVHHEPLNKGKIVGLKAPFKVKDISALAVGWSRWEV